MPSTASKKNSDGWWDVPALRYWACPECHELSLADDWVERETACGDCGSHDGRVCPECDVTFDHVWGAPQIAAESE